MILLGFNFFITLLVYSFLSDRECCFLLHVHLKPNSYLALHVHKYQEVQLDKFNFNFSSDFGFQRLSKRNNYDQPNPFHMAHMANHMAFLKNVMLL